MPPTQQKAATAIVSAVSLETNDRAAGAASKETPPATMAQRAIAKSEALKATITHRPKTSSPLKASMTVDPPALPPRIAASALHMRSNRFAVEAGY